MNEDSGEGESRMFPDPENYRKLSEPFESLAAANQSVQAFFEAVGELRKKHKITNVYVIVSSTAKTEEGGEPEFLTTGSFGDALKRESMAAYAFGVEQTERQKAIGNLLAGRGVKSCPKEGKS